MDNLESLREKVKNLERIIREKDSEIEELRGKLRQSTENQVVSRSSALIQIAIISSSYFSMQHVFVDSRGYVFFYSAMHWTCEV